MRRIMLFVSVGLLAVVVPFCILHAQTSTNHSDASDLERPIHNCERQVASWRRVEIVEIVFLVVTFSLGGVIAALQKLKNDAAKNATIVLGVITAMLTGVNGTLFPADVKTLRRAVFDGDAVINQMWIKVQAAENPQSSPEDRKTATDDYAKTLNQFQAVGDSLTGTSPPTATNVVAFPRMLPVVYAQSQGSLPAWAKQPPTGTETALYFVGKASDQSLAVAKQNSADAALYKAAVALLPAAPNASRKALLDLIKSSGVTQDSAFAYDSKSKSYDYYTLLRLAPAIQDIVKTLPQATISALEKVQAKGWRPSDLTANASSGLFVLDSSGGVSKLVPAQQGSLAIQKLFQIARSESGSALAASANAVFVATRSPLGCKVYRFSLSTKAVASRLLAAHDRCFGITTDGTAFYVTMPDRKEIRYWDNWEASDSHTWSLAPLGAPGYIEFDGTGNRLIVADDASGTAYGVSIPDGKPQLLSGNLGSVQSIAASRFHTLFASGKKVLFLARSDNQGENPPLGWPPLPGGHIVGVAVDSSDELWVADYDNKVVEGPFPLI
jgi:hypothetical protein